MRVQELDLWTGFRAVAEYKSFTRAAETLNLTPPQLSKRIAKLEGIIGVQLFRRSTRSVVLTDEAKALVLKISPILDELRRVERSFEDLKKLSGVIRITSIPFIAAKILIPVIEEFKKEYPSVEFELDLTTSFRNIIDENFDIALRIEEPKESNLIYKKLLPNQLLLCATPDYIKRYGTPEKIEDLSEHKLLFLDIHQRVKFINTDISLDSFNRQKFITCNDGRTLTDLALSSHGILVRSQIDVLDLLKQEKLVRVLKDESLENFGNLHAVIANRRYLAPRVRTFLNFLYTKIEALH